MLEKKGVGEYYSIHTQHLQHTPSKGTEHGIKTKIPPSNTISQGRT
jgi:hypothetical protein